MQVIVNAHDIKIEKKEPINQNEFNINKCNFEFSEDYDSNLVKVALFTVNNKSYKQIIIDDVCSIPNEVLFFEGWCVLGVYAYKEENRKLVLRYSPKPKRFYIDEGSYKENAENSKPITPSELEQYQQALNDGLNEVREELKNTKQIGNDVQKIGIEAKQQGDYAKEQGDYAKEKGDYANSQGLKAESIANVVKGKLDNNEFVGPQGTQGEKGDKGEKGDCNFATFDVIDGKLIMYKTDDMLLDFRLNGNKLEVLI